MKLHSIDVSWLTHNTKVEKRLAVHFFVRRAVLRSLEKPVMRLRKNCLPKIGEC